MGKEEDWLRITGGEKNVFDGYFVCRTQEDIDLTVKRLDIIKTLLPHRESEGVEPIDGGSDVLSALSQ